MPMNYTAPGVYIEEVPSGSSPIVGVGTAVAAFMGFTEKVPEGLEVGKFKKIYKNIKPSSSTVGHHGADHVAWLDQ